MKKLLIIVVLALFGWQAYTRYGGQSSAAGDFGTSSIGGHRAVEEQAPTQSFKCDGRTHCSQMTSCEEATFFLRNCPGVKMDGNNDGVPCEQQWCR
jgi:hypothetical protein